MSDEIKEINSLESLESFNSSNAALIECSKFGNPYLVTLAAASTIGKDRELQSIIEKRTAEWLDDNKELYKVMKKQKSSDIAAETLSSIYEQDANIINKTIKQMCDEIKKYCNNEYFNYSSIKIVYCSKENDLYETLSDLANKYYINCLTPIHIMGFLTTHLNPDLYAFYKLNKKMVFPWPFSNSFYKDNLLKELVDKIALLIDQIKIYIHEDENRVISPIFCIENEFVYLAFDEVGEEDVKIINLQRTLWSYTKYPIYEHSEAGFSTRIRLFKI